MLMKMMRLDYENIKRELPVSVALMTVAAGFSMFLHGAAAIALGLSLAFAVILVLMGLNRMLGSAMFGTEGAFHMVLPVDSKIRAGSKALIGGLWLGLLLTVFFLIVASGYADYGALHEVRMRFIERTALYLMSIAFSPVTVGVSMALIPAILVLASTIFCTGIMIIQIEMNSISFRKFKGLGLLLITTFAAALFGGIFVGLILLLRKLVLLHLGGLWLVVVMLGFLIAAALLLLWGCARMIDTKMNLS